MAEYSVTMSALKEGKSNPAFDDIKEKKEDDDRSLEKPESVKQETPGGLTTKSVSGASAKDPSDKLQDKLILVPTSNREKTPVWEKTQINDSFANFLTKRHGYKRRDSKPNDSKPDECNPHQCNMEKGIKVLKSNDFGIVTLAECQECKESFSTVFEGAKHYQVRIVKAQKKKGDKTPAFYSLQPEKREKPLEPGDHIAWHRKYAIWHHGIVIETGVTEKGVTEKGVTEKGVTEKGVTEKGVTEKGVTEKGVTEKGVTEKGVTEKGVNEKSDLEIHSSNDCCNQSEKSDSSAWNNFINCCSHLHPNKNQCHLIDRIKVIEHTHADGKFKITEAEYDLYECMDVCRFEYSVSYPPEYTIELAKATMKRFKEKEEEKKKEKGKFHELVYDPFGSNCEHFARRCKTGISDSGQVKDCLRDCGKGFLMALWNVVSLAIFFFCELFVQVKDLERSRKKDNVSANYSITPIPNNHLLKISISVSLSGLFFIIYCIYSISREISQIRLPFVRKNSDPENGCLGGRCKINRGCCYRNNYACCWICCCLVLCRPFYICFTECSRFRTCCSGQNPKKFNHFCTNYFNIIIRVLLRELIASVPPVVTFVLFDTYVKTVKNETLKAFYGLLASLGVCFISLPLGAVIGSQVEVLCLGCCLVSCAKRQQT